MERTKSECLEWALDDEVRASFTDTSRMSDDDFGRYLGLITYSPLEEKNGILVMRVRDCKKIQATDFQNIRVCGSFKDRVFIDQYKADFLANLTTYGTRMLNYLILHHSEFS